MTVYLLCGLKANNAHCFMIEPLSIIDPLFNSLINSLILLSYTNLFLNNTLLYFVCILGFYINLMLLCVFFSADYILQYILRICLCSYS